MALTIAELQGSVSRRRREAVMRTVFQGAATLSILISLLILFVLVRGTLNFFREIGWDWGVLTDSGWFPRRSRFDLRTIVVGSIVMGAVAMVVAVPFGLGTAIYLSEYAPRKGAQGRQAGHRGARRHPVGGRRLLHDQLHRPVAREQGLRPVVVEDDARAGIGIGILVIPIMASVSEDASPRCRIAARGELRLGARKMTTVVSVVLPAAVSGLVAALDHRRVPSDRRDDGRRDGRRLRRLRSVHG